MDDKESEKHFVSIESSDDVDEAVDALFEMLFAESFETWKANKAAKPKGGSDAAIG